jgi:predicted ATPase
MRLNRSEEVWNELLQDLRSLIPSIRRIRFMANMPHALLFDTESGDNLQAAEISEGTILVLGMLAILHADPRPSVLLIDDMDRGLHPRAQQEWVQLLRRLLEKHADLQILATTHSPYLLDNMCFEEVRMTLLHEGQTLCASLTAHEKYEKWKDEMAPGEMWSLFGEQWLASKKEEHVAP